MRELFPFGLLFRPAGLTIALLAAFSTRAAQEVIAERRGRADNVGREASAAPRRSVPRVRIATKGAEGVVPTPVAANARIVTWFGDIRGGWFQERLHFKDAATAHLDEAAAASIYGVLGGGGEVVFGRTVTGGTLGLWFGNISGRTVSGVTNNFSAKTFSIGLQFEPYLLYRFTRTFRAGLALGTVSHFAFWPASATGAIQEKFTVTPSITLRTQLRLGRYSLHVSGGFTDPIPKLLFSAGFTLPIGRAYALADTVD